MVGSLKWDISHKVLSTMSGIFSPKKVFANIFVMFISLSIENLVN